MRKYTTWLAIILMLLAPMGCASEKAWTDYHSSIDRQTDALLEFARQKGIRESSARAQMMQTYSTSMSRAATTPGATDDVLLAFAWGVEIATPRTTALPKLPTITPPDKSSDLVRAWTPMVALATPFLYPLAYGWSQGSGGTTIKADNGARVVTDSQNAGSYNKAGNNMTNSALQDNNNGSCEGCDDGASVNPVTADPDDPDSPTQLPTECADYPDSIFASGTWWINSNATCSCESRAAGRC